MKNLRTIRSLLLLLGASFSLLACSSSEPAQPAPVELTADKKNVEAKLDLPEADLFRYAQQLYEAGLYSLARRHFETVASNYPLGPYADYSQVKLADSYFHAGDPLTAAALFEEYVRAHPSGSSFPYMLMMAGVSNQLSSAGAGRDTVPLEKALDFYDRFLRDLADSPYAPLVKARRGEVLEALAEHERTILSYYEGRDQRAFERRSARFAERWEPVVKSVTAERNALFEPHAVNFDQTSVAKKSRPVVALATAQTNFKRTSNESALPVIQRVSCLAGDGVVLFLNKPIPDEQLPRAERRDGSLVFKFAARTNAEQTVSYSCRFKNDVSLEIDGTVQLHGTHAASILSLSNPERVVIGAPIS